MFEEQDGEEGLWGWSVVAGGGPGRLSGEFVGEGRARTHCPDPHVCFQSITEDYRECGHEGEILTQVRDDGDLENGHVRGDGQSTWDGDTGWRWIGQDLGGVGGREIKADS